MRTIYLLVKSRVQVYIYLFQRCQYDKICVEIVIEDDNILEGNEYFTFNLSVKTNGTGITFAPGQMTGTVHIKDIAPGLSTTIDTLYVVTTPTRVL